MKAQETKPETKETIEASAATADSMKAGFQSCLDAKYQKADLQSNVKDKCKHLSTDQQKKLLQLLTKYESLFDGTLGD